MVPGEGKPEQPTRAEMDEILGDGEALLETFLERNPELRPEWKYYGAKHGAIGMGFVLGERAYDRLLTLDLRPSLRKTVEGARRFPEGRGIRLVLREDSDLEDAQVLLDIKGST